MKLTLVQFAELIGFSMMLACGQALFKLSATSVPSLVSVNGLLALAVNPWFWAALVLYGAATLLYLYILQQVPLSVAYPFVALGFIVIPAISWAFFKEPMSLYYAAGVAFILIGIGFITVLHSRAV